MNTWISVWMLFVLSALSQSGLSGARSSGAVASNIAPTFTTWYVRTDGGGRYDALRAAAGTFADAEIGCNGKADAPYPGSGTNQPCAFNDYRFMYDDQMNDPRAWVMQGGDTLIIRSCIAQSGDDPDSCRVGHNQGTVSNDVWCNGGDDASTCGNAYFPSGSPAKHTRVLGGNYQNCGSKSSMTKIFGGNTVGSVFYLAGQPVSYVDIQCLDITQHSDCQEHGIPVVTTTCTKTFPVSDVSDNGIVTDQNASNIYLQDLWVHGFPNRGIIGNIGGLVSAINVDVAYNVMAGWDLSPDNCSSNCGSGGGSIIASGLIIEWNGCAQQQPIVDTYPVTNCWGQDSGGYGDGMGTPGGFCMTFSIDRSIFRYNTQDGLDFGHLDSASNCTGSITNSIAVGNVGNTLKWGQGMNTMLVTNNLTLSNCLVMTLPMTGAPANYGQYITDLCRAGGSWSFNIEDGLHLTFANNTTVGYAPNVYIFGCGTPTVSGCSTATITYVNNTVLGYDNPATYSLGGQSGGPTAWYCQENFPDGTSTQQPCLPYLGTWTRSNNIWYGLRTSECPSTFGVAAPNESCASPLLTGQPTGNGGSFVESELANFNYMPTAASFAVAGGTTYTGLPLMDYYGITTTSPPVIGAVNYVP